MQLLKSSRFKNSNVKGFSLIEILVAVALFIPIFLGALTLYSLALDTSIKNSSAIPLETTKKSALLSALTEDIEDCSVAFPIEGLLVINNQPFAEKIAEPKGRKGVCGIHNPGEFISSISEGYRANGKQLSVSNEGSRCSALLILKEFPLIKAYYEILVENHKYSIARKEGAEITHEIKGFMQPNSSIWPEFKWNASDKSISLIFPNESTFSELKFKPPFQPNPLS